MKKIISIISAFVVGLSMVVLTPLLVTAQTSTLPTSCSGISLTDELTLGSTGSSVTCLQALLNQNSSTMVATTGPGSPGNETAFYGPLTEKAVIAFQNLNASTILTPEGFTTGTGVVGPNTRNALNAMIASEGGNSLPANPQ
jgi:peptidoglycan hydrolase-like protein with peptidoglycan-binding domain